MAPLATYAALALLPLASAHMMISNPAVWGYQDDSLENPLTSGSNNWFCHGKKKSDAQAGSQVTLNAGGKVSIPVVCGEANKNGKADGGANDICTDAADFHMGGGCGLSIAYKSNDPKMNDFVLFSQTSNCPNKANSVSWDIPANLPACDDCVCSWTWVPNPESSASEMYMNCFNCKVISNTKGSISGGIKLSDHMWAVPGFPDGGEADRMYRNRLPNGALKVEVGGRTDKPEENPSTRRRTPRRRRLPPPRPMSLSTLPSSRPPRRATRRSLITRLGEVLSFLIVHH
ncbi:hypothetical protein DFJ77DRAFT_17176 [Powellomyces hirtus]|nr:hypothetical protein DFJ77DRAFT_17176 [Powellomyces hirtus]